MMEISEKIELAKQQLMFGQLDQAEMLCNQVLHSNRRHPDALHVMGLIFHRMGKTQEAITLISKAIKHNPLIAVYYYNLGFILTASGEHAKAIKAYRESIALKPDYAEAINNLGLILYDQDMIEESIVFFQQAIQSKPDFTNAYYNLGMAYQAQGNPQAAIAAYDEVLKIYPDSVETRFNRSLSLLLTENYEDGWVEYEQRFRNLNDPIKKWNDKDAHRWDGTSFSGKRLLVLDEQGIGDTLQFIRYLPMVKELGGTVIFETIQPLIRLLLNFQGIDELLDRSSTERSTLAFDLFIPLMSLPGIFNTTLKTIPARVPYIFPDTKKTQYWRRRLKKGETKVGIVWAGKSSTDYQQFGNSGLEHVELGWAGQPASNFASSRLTRLEYFGQLSKIEGVQLFGLQKGDAAIQAKKLSDVFEVDNLGQEFSDFSDTAAAIGKLDLVISVDTSVAHLAGAMGKPVWMLIPLVPDWRWLREREDSPWYPSMRLFRQTKKNEWDDVFERVAEELYALVHQ